MGHSQRQLNQLSECLIALPPENDGMLLSEFDGFVAGILVCPEMILPNEWLPIVWGEEIAPHFTDMDQAKNDAGRCHGPLQPRRARSGEDAHRL